MHIHKNTVNGISKYQPRLFLVSHNEDWKKFSIFILFSAIQLMYMENNPHNKRPASF